MSAVRTPKRVALVTGVGRRKGIGAAICRELAADGFDIAFSWWEAADRAAPWGTDEGFGYGFAGELADQGARAIGIEADLSQPDEPRRLVAEANAALGPISVLVNNAAVSERGSIDDVSAGRSIDITTLMCVEWCFSRRRS